MAADPKVKDAPKPRTRKAPEKKAETAVAVAVPASIPAAELTDAEKQALAEQAYTVNERVKEGIRAGHQALWILASALYEFEETSGWLALGYDKKSEWLADPDIQLTQRTYNRLVHAWRVLVVQRELPPADLVGIDVSKVDIVLPAVSSGRVTLEKALDDARGMAASDLRESYMKPRIGRPASDNTAPDVPASTPDAPSAEHDPTEDVVEAQGNVSDVQPTMPLNRALELLLAADEAIDAWGVAQTAKSGNQLRDALAAIIEYVRDYSA